MSYKHVVGGSIPPTPMKHFANNKMNCEKCGNSVVIPNMNDCLKCSSATRGMLIGINDIRNLCSIIESEINCIKNEKDDRLLYDRLSEINNLAYHVRRAGYDIRNVVYNLQNRFHRFHKEEVDE